MELRKQQIQGRYAGKPVTDQFMIDDDYNVPDSKPDMKRIVVAEGELKTEEMKRVENYLKISGKLCFQVLYIADEAEERMSSLEGTLPFEEMVYIEGNEEGHFQMKESRMDFSAVMVHSRKLSIKAVVELEILPSQTKDEEITVDVDVDVPLCRKKGNMEILTMTTNKRDTYRIKEEMQVPGTKENIGTLLWTDVKNRRLDTRLEQDMLAMSGELSVFIFYESVEGKLDWAEKNVPYEGKVECFGADEEMFHHVEAKLDDISTDIRMDEDGEPRVIGIEATLKMKIAIYKEEKIEYLEDAYSLDKKCTIVREPKQFESMVMQNHSKYKIDEQIMAPELKDSILQICHSSAGIQIEKTSRTDEGILIEGVLHLSVLYVKQSDQVPFDIWQGMVPFVHVIECNEMSGEMEYDVCALMEQLSVSLLGSDELELKAVLAFHCLVKKPIRADAITGIGLEPYTKEELERRPGIVGYVVKDGDTVWELAKRYLTTEESVRQVNELGEKEPKEGDKLLIFRERVGIL